MKTLSVRVSEADYELFQRAAQAQQKPVAQLIREAMALYRQQKLGGKNLPLTELPIFPVPLPCGELPDRADLYTEIFEQDQL